MEESSMKRPVSSKVRSAACLIWPIAAALVTSVPTSAETIYGLTQQQTLISFDSATPGTITSSVAITGLNLFDSLVEIDFRPATGQLYALSDRGVGNSLYVINTTTGVATLVGAVSPIPATFSGTGGVGFDFNPVVDRIRMVDPNDSNVRVNPDTAGTVIDTTLSYQAGDPFFGTTPSIVGLAYSNNFSGAASTSLYDIDYALDTLALQVNPNGGLLSTVGPLGFNAGPGTAFDISGVTGVAYLADASPFPGITGFYTLNLSTGAATLIGGIGGGVSVRSIAAPVGQAIGVPEPSTWAMMLLGLVASGALIRRTRKTAAQGV